MQGEIITIGNELTSGRTRDINSWYAAGRLTASGFSVIRITSVGDDEQTAAEALKRASLSSRFVIVTGGLGSTEDDMTCKIAADALSRPLRLDEQLLGKIRQYVDARGRTMSPALEKMAFMPKGARMIHPTGAMCGFSLVEKGIHFYFLPGIPEEMRHIMDAFVIPELLSLCERPPVTRQRILKLYGLDEPTIAEAFSALTGRPGDVIFGFYPKFPENHITMSLRGPDEAAVMAALNRAEQEVRSILGSYVFASGDQEMEEVVGRLLTDKKMTLSAAESCTGGLIGHRLTNVPGSSQYFQGGVTCYSNLAKVHILGVDPETLKTHGAVSAESVEQMARGVRRCMMSDLGLAVTGIAGPDGGSDEKPVGTVFIGLDSPHGTNSWRYCFPGDRKQIKLNTSTMALDWVRRHLRGHPFLPRL